MSKYDSLKGKLPGFQQEASFQQKVDEVKDRYQALEQSDLARTFNLERQKKKNLEAEISELNINLEALSQLLNDQFEATGISKFQLATGETCYQQTEVYSSVTDQGALLEYIKKSKQQALLTLAWGTMNALNKERLMAGKPALPGTQPFLKPSVRLRGGSSLETE
jgi:phage host-nuclease inhibitor protein Gam